MDLSTVTLGFALAFVVLLFVEVGRSTRRRAATLHDSHQQLIVHNAEIESMHGRLLTAIEERDLGVVLELERPYLDRVPPGPDGDPHRASVLYLTSRVFASNHQLEDAVERVRRAARIFAANGDGAMARTCIALAAPLLQKMGRLAEAREVATQAPPYDASASDAGSHVFDAAAVQLVLAAVAWQLAAPFEEHLRNVVDLARHAEDAPDAILIELCMIEALLLIGQTDAVPDCLARIDTLRASSPEDPLASLPGTLDAFYFSSRAWYLLLSGAASRIEVADLLGEATRRIGDEDDQPAWVARWVRALALLRELDERGARDAFDDAVARFSNSGRVGYAAVYRFAAVRELARTGVVTEEDIDAAIAACESLGQVGLVRELEQLRHSAGG
jgi:hypothetical protein